MTSRRYTIVLADRSSGVVRRFTVSLGPALMSIALLFSLPVLMGLGAKWSARSAIADLERSNISLQMENTSYKDVTAELSSQITSLEAAVDELGVRARVDPVAGRAMDKLPAIVKSRAMGGGAAESLGAPVLGAAFGSPDNALGVLRDLLSVIGNRLESVRSGVERRQALAAATPAIWPVPGWLSSRYGTRQDPFTGASGFHPGLDISADAGQPVHATADGTVGIAGMNGGYGNLVTIDHGYGLTTRYGHLSRIAVTSGQQVRRGDVIGYVGSTGRSTSPHLHYEILVNGQLTDPFKLLNGQ